jgi:hypothetical protein
LLVLKKKLARVSSEDAFNVSVSRSGEVNDLLRLRCCCCGWVLQHSLIIGGSKLVKKFLLWLLVLKELARVWSCFERDSTPKKVRLKRSEAKLSQIFGGRKIVKRFPFMIACFLRKLERVSSSFQREYFYLCFLKRWGWRGAKRSQIIHSWLLIFWGSLQRLLQVGFRESTDFRLCFLKRRGWRGAMDFEDGGSGDGSRFMECLRVGGWRIWIGLREDCLSFEEEIWIGLRRMRRRRWRWWWSEGLLDCGGREEDYLTLCCCGVESVSKNEISWFGELLRVWGSAVMTQTNYCNQIRGNTIFSGEKSGGVEEFRDAAARVIRDWIQVGI